jgi:UDP-N-acetylmuramoyl-tripeptide--D-alanyl-D-alanine ligase
MTLWTTADIKAALSLRHPHSVNITGVSLDTRTLKAGDFFVCLRGETSDGHDYIDTALQAGAGAVLSEKPHPDPRVIRVDNTFEAMQALARYRRIQLNDAFIIGITGSVGKTTTKELLRVMLSDQGATTATTGNYNNHLGVPVTLMRSPKTASFVIVEMGMNHAGELRNLTHLVRPHLALVTTVAPSHIGHFASLRDIALAKAEIYEGVTSGGIALYGDDHAYTDVLDVAAQQSGARRIFSIPTNSLTESDHFDWQGLTFDLADYADDPALKACIACALAVVAETGASLQKAYEALSQFERPKGRGNIIEVNGVRIIHDAYNASPASMRAALQRLAVLPCSGRRIALLGDMLEMGKHSSAYHTALLDDLVGKPIDTVHTVGPAMAALHAKLPKHQQGLCVPDVEALIDVFQKYLKPKDLVLVKGSAGMKLGGVVEKMVDSFSS